MRTGIKIAVIFVFALTLLLCSGCWSRREPDTMAVVNSLLNDMNNDEYSFLFEIMEPSPPIGAKDKGGSSSAIYVSGNGNSLAEVLRNTTDSLDRRLYVGHIDARFLTERLAKKGISPVLDFYLRVHKIRQNPFMVVVKGDNPRLIYECETGLADNLGTFIMKMSKIQMRATGHSVFVRTLDFIEAYYKEGLEPVMGAAEVVENPEIEEQKQNSTDSKAKSYLLKYSGLAAFKGDQLMGYLDDIETRAYNMVIGDIQGGYISIPSTGRGERTKGTVVELAGSKPSIEIKYEDEPEISVVIKCNVTLAQQAFPADLSSKEYKKEIQNAFNKRMEEQIQAAISKAQELGSDIFGFGAKVHIKYPDKWPKIKDRWNEFFSQTSIKVKVESKIIGVGEMKSPFTGED